MYIYIYDYMYIYMYIYVQLSSVQKPFLAPLVRWLVHKDSPATWITPFSPISWVVFHPRTNHQPTGVLNMAQFNM